MLYPLLLVGVMVIWGGSFIAIKIALTHLTPFELVLARFIPSALLLFPIGLVMERRRRVALGFWRSLTPRQKWSAVAVAFLAVPGYHFCLNYGETLIPAGWASLVIALNPAAITLFAALLLGERIGARRIAGIALAFAGLFYIALTHDVLTGDGRSLPPLLRFAGLAVTLGAVVCWGLFTVVSKRLMRGREPLAALGWIILWGTAWLLPGLKASFPARMAETSPTVWLAVGYLSLLCTVGAFLVWFRVLEKWDASRAGAFIYLVPLIALVAGNRMLQEPLDLGIILGAMGVLGGVVLAGMRTPQENKRT